MFDSLTELTEKIYLGKDSTIEFKESYLTERVSLMKSLRLPTRTVGQY